MKKIIIIENRSFFKIKLEKILTKNSSYPIDALNSNLITETYLKYIAKDVGLFIIDLDAADYDGLELTAMIHNINPDEPIPIIALSKNVDIGILKKAVAMGCNDFMLKPFNDMDLVYKVKTLLGLKKNDNNSPNIFKATSSDGHDEMNLAWAQDFEIQMPEIDEEHRGIIQQYTSLYQLMKDGKGHEYYLELINFLNDYVQTHFTHEQKIHEAHNYNLKDEHIRIHEEFKRSVENIYDAGKDKTITDGDLIKISLFIKNWLIHHILIEDRKFGNFINKKNASL